MGIRAKLASLLRSKKVSLFQSLEVEISSPCNLRCETCPNRDNERPTMELPMGVIASMVDELEVIGFEGTFSPHFYNEPLMDSRLVDILRLVREKLPRVTINLFTNFTLMTTSLYRELHPVVDEFIVTVDEPVVLKKVERMSSELSDEEKSKLRVRSITDIGLSNRAGAIDMDSKDLVQPESCGFVDYMVVDAAGDVHLCCNDYFGKAIYGNVKEQGLADIWFSDTFARDRELARKLKHPLCDGCYWSQPE